MSTRIICLVALSLVVVGGCAVPPPEAPAVDVEAEAQAIRDASMIWLEAVQARDGAAIDSLLHSNATVMFDGEINQGLAEIQASRDEVWAAHPEATWSWTTSEVGVAASGDLAYERGSFTHDPDGMGEAPAEQGEYLTVWKKIGGEWKALYDAGTTIEAEEEMAGEG